MKSEDCCDRGRGNRQGQRQRYDGSGEDSVRCRQAAAQSFDPQARTDKSKGAKEQDEWAQQRRPLRPQDFSTRKYSDGQNNRR